MQFTDADLQEFIEIWQEEFQESISMDEAHHAASLLMQLYLSLLTSVPAASLRVSESSLNNHRT